MISNCHNAPEKYPFKTARVYLNAATAALSFFLALMFLADPILFASYLTLTSTITIALFWLKLNPLTKKVASSQTDAQKTEYEPKTKRRWLIIVGLLGLLSLPFALFLLSPFLPLYIWFIIIASLASGIGVSEVLFYIYCKKRWMNVHE